VPEEKAMTRSTLIELFEQAATLIAEREVTGLTETTTISSLGIDSLGMLELVGQMEMQLGIHLPDDQLVAVNTLRELLDLVERQHAARVS
jgi:acyl carrier protein